MTPCYAMAALIGLLVLASCKKLSVDVPPINPCKDKKPFLADSTIEELVGDTSFITDKALAPGYVQFRARGARDSVRWYFGGSDNSSTRERMVLYIEKPEPPIGVTMIGHRKADWQCFPSDRTVDTVKKVLTLVPRNEQAAIVGRFHGYSESNPAHTFSVVTSYCDAVWGCFSEAFRRVPGVHNC